jgi:signal transduction histidine kinase
MASLAEEVIDEYKLQIKERKIKFNSSFAHNVPLIKADPKILRMVIQNLLSNSIKYTPEGGRLTMSIVKNEKDIVFKIKDTGYGIPENQKNKIFTKLFRADNVIGKDTEGTGLGLYIAKSIVEQSGGTIRFESKENEGTTFFVTLPLQKTKKVQNI